MAGPINWLSQVVSVTKFGLKGIPQRLGSVFAAVVGIAGVVTVLVCLLSMAAGFMRAMMSSTPPDSVIVLRSGADTEMVSGFSREEARIVSQAPQLAQAKEGPLSSAELFVIVDLPKRSTGTDANVPLRGIEKSALQVRENFKFVAGHPFTWGTDEVIVGAGAAREFAGLDVGSKIKLGKIEWPVVGVFTAGSGVAESEIWADASVLQQAYQRGDSFQSIYARLSSPGAFQTFKDTLTSDPRLSVKVMRQSEFFAEQSSSVTKLITTVGYVVGLLMAIGAIFGALNTMYSSVAARTREIATLRALGFGRGAVVVSVMLESLALAFLGGAIGAGFAYAAFNGFQTATINWQSFSQITFAFAVTPALLIQGIVWAAFIGLVGGLFPAIRAARLPIASALREL